MLRTDIECAHEDYSRQRWRHDFVVSGTSTPLCYGSRGGSRSRHTSWARHEVLRRQRYVCVFVTLQFRAFAQRVRARYNSWVHQPLLCIASSAFFCNPVLACRMRMPSPLTRQRSFHIGVMVAETDCLLSERLVPPTRRKSANGCAFDVENIVNYN